MKIAYYQIGSKRPTFHPGHRLSKMFCDLPHFKGRLKTRSQCSFFENLVFSQGQLRFGSLYVCEKDRCLSNSFWFPIIKVKNKSNYVWEHSVVILEIYSHAFLAKISRKQRFYYRNDSTKYFFGESKFLILPLTVW